MRRMRKTFKRPKTPWNNSLIEEERKLIREFGLKSKKELWKARSVLREYRRRAREITANKDERDEKVLLDKLVKFNILNKTQGIDDVLALTVEDILNRRLQTIIFRKNMSNTIKHARQLIVHGHIKINERKVVFPSYYVPNDAEGKIQVESFSQIKPQPKAAPPKKEKAPEMAPEAPKEEGDKK